MTRLLVKLLAALDHVELAYWRREQALLDSLGKVWR